MRKLHNTTITTSFPDGHVSFLLGDMYAITMLYAWWKANMAERRAVFYASFRKLPAGAGYAIAGGTDHLIEFLKYGKFHEEDLEYIASQTDENGKPLYEPAFIEYLRTMRWSCDVSSVREGTVVFPHEVLHRVEGPVGMCELIEGALLNFTSDQSSTMSRAVRMLIAANWKQISDNSLRRGGGPGGALSKALAAYKAGFAGTSNMLAGRVFGIPSKGTMAHCFVMSFEDELEAFEAFGRAFPNTTIDLVDTTDTINGIRNAIKAGLRMKAEGHKLKAIRLDSGDLVKFSRLARTMLDAAGLDYVKVNATNSLNETSLTELEAKGAPNDFYASGDAIAESGLFGMVYKIAAIEDEHGNMRPTVKLSDQDIKLSMPGRLGARRYFDKDGKFLLDVIYDVDKDTFEDRFVKKVTGSGEALIPQGARYEELLYPIVQNGEVIAEVDSFDTVRAFIRRQIAQLDEGHLRLLNPETYTVAMTNSLATLRDDLVRKARRRALLAGETTAV